MAEVEDFDLRASILGFIARGLVRLIGCTLRYQFENEEVVLDKPPHGQVICGWHGRSFPYAYRFRGKGYWVIISLSRDGRIQKRVFEGLGYQIIRGSTGRGGVRALAEAITALKKGGTMALTPDGPRGPSGEVQPGVMVMAQKSGATLIPVGISARPRRLFRSWDRYLIPMPFARVFMKFGQPLTVPPKATEQEVEALRLQLQVEMLRLEAEAEAALGFSPK
ncbi:MAG: lysophospholipid acyltransferase family protein [Armatimonadetes bacterium]|nr:lysophospholipid acyltransferase family protein [Armatimonadota bacterium]